MAEMMSEKEPDRRYCERQISLFMLRAHWWMASATSGHYKQRRIADGNGIEFTDGEKIAAAMATAQRHIELANEYSEKLAALDEELP